MEKQRKRTSGAFVKGDPRINRKGRPPGKTDYTDLLRKKLPPEEFAKIVADMVKKGNESIIKHVYDRLEGKVPDKHELTGADGEDLNIEVVIKDVASRD